MDGTQASDRHHDLAVGASLAWYEDVFAVHGILTRCEDGLWSALGTPPRWHSAAKTLLPDVTAARVLRAVDDFESCSVADSFATLDLADDGFEPLFRATWLYRAAPAHPVRRWPDGWSVVKDEGELAEWNTAQDTTGVLVPELLDHPRFTFLVRRSSAVMVAGAVLHHVEDCVDLSNTWAAGDEAVEIPSLLECADRLHPGLPVVGYSRDSTLSHFTDAGFEPTAPQVVWVRHG